jgi:peptide/nickel transport system permease protein
MNPSQWFRVLGMRFIQAVVAFCILHGVVFLCFDILPGPELKLGGILGADPVRSVEFRERTGLGGSLGHRYITSLSSVIRGDLGTALDGQAVAHVMRQRLSISSAALGVSAVILALPFIALFWRCERQTSKLDNIGRLAVVGVIPAFITAVILNATLHHLVRTNSLSFDFTKFTTFLVGFSGALLPSATLCIAGMKAARKIVRADFYRTHIAIGSPPDRIKWLVVPNIWRELSPLIPRLILTTLFGTVFAETVFQVRGFGSLFAEALQRGDFAVIQGWTLLAGLLAIIARILESIHTE